MLKHLGFADGHRDGRVILGWLQKLRESIELYNARNLEDGLSFQRHTKVKPDISVNQIGF